MINARITSFYLTKEDILLLIKNLDSSKAHGWDSISVKMIKISSETITVPLKIILEQSLKEIIERVIYNVLFNYFKDNKLFTPSQSGFLPGDSCIGQLLLITHETQTAFDNNPVDVRGVFLDILIKYGIDGELLSLLENYIENHKQRVVLNGQTSEWRE